MGLFITNPGNGLKKPPTFTYYVRYVNGGLWDTDLTLIITSTLCNL